MTSFVVDGDRATLCATTSFERRHLIQKGDYSEPPPSAETCASVDLSTGTFRKATKVRDQPPPVAWRDERAPKLLELPKLAADDDPYSIATSADGTRAVATGGRLDGIALLDAKSGKRLRVIKPESSDPITLEGPMFVGGSIFATVRGHDQGYVFSQDGKQIVTTVHDKPAGARVAQAVPFHVRDDLWLFSGGIVNVKTGERQPLPLSATPACEDCDGFDYWERRATKTPTRIVAIHDAFVIVVSTTAWKVTFWRIPPCS